MRLKATIIITLKSFITNWRQIILVYAIFPLLLAVAMAYFQKDIFKPDINMDKIDITIVDKDNSNASKDFKEVFQAEGINKLFKISDKGKYVITVPKGYEDNIANLKDTAISVNEKGDGSYNNEIIIKAVINEYGKSLTEFRTIYNKIDGLSVKDKEKLFSNVTSSINKLSSVSAIKNNMLKGEKTLTSYENQAASMITYIFFMIVMGCTAGYHKDKENGSFKRLMSTPITRSTFFNLDLVIFFISSFMFGLLYIITFGVAGFAFKDTNPAIILLILICQSMLITSISGLLVAFLNKKNTNTILLFVMYLQVIFGGIFIPAKQISNKVFNTLTEFAPGNVLSGAYKSCILFNSFDKVAKYLGIMVLISMGIYAVSIFKVKTKWEE